MSSRAPADLGPEPSVEEFETLVLGLGNILWADEGFGIRAVEALNEAWTFPEGVRVMDGGTQGIFLMPWVRTATNLLILDAIDFGLEPGSLRLIEGDDVPRFMGVKKVSMHQAGFQEVLMTAQLSGEFPERIALVGVQPELLNDYGAAFDSWCASRSPARWTWPLRCSGAGASSRRRGLPCCPTASGSVPAN